VGKGKKKECLPNLLLGRVEGTGKGGKRRGKRGGKTICPSIFEGGKNEGKRRLDAPPALVLGWPKMPHIDWGGGRERRKEKRGSG